MGVSLLGRNGERYALSYNQWSELREIIEETLKRLLSDEDQTFSEQECRDVAGALKQRARDPKEPMYYQLREAVLDGGLVEFLESCGGFERERHRDTEAT